MSETNPNLRESLNLGSGPYRLADTDRAVCLGDLYGLLISGLTPTEAGLNPNASGQVLDLASAPNCILNVVATAGVGVLNVPLTLLITNDEQVTPAPGQVLWDGPGRTRVRFNATDAFTAVDVTYTVAGVPRASILERNLGQSDQ